MAEWEVVARWGGYDALVQSAADEAAAASTGDACHPEPGSCGRHGSGLGWASRHGVLQPAQYL